LADRPGSEALGSVHQAGLDTGFFAAAASTKQSSRRIQGMVGSDSGVPARSWLCARAKVELQERCYTCNRLLAIGR
jgi:hypothetical protein